MVLRSVCTAANCSEQYNGTDVLEGEEDIPGNYTMKQELGTGHFASVQLVEVCQKHPHRMLYGTTGQQHRISIYHHCRFTAPLHAAVPLHAIACYVAPDCMLHSTTSIRRGLYAAGQGWGSMGDEDLPQGGNQRQRSEPEQQMQPINGPSKLVLPGARGNARGKSDETC